MSRKKVYVIFIIFISSLNILQCVFNSEVYRPVDYIVEVMGLGFPDFTLSYLSLLITDMFPIFVFEIIFGIYIYRRYCTASVYYFSRQNNRKIWFIRETIKLFIYLVGYFGGYLTLSYLFGTIFCLGKLSLDGLSVLINIMILFSLYTFLFTLLLNICSIVMGSQNAYLLLFGVQMVLAMSMIIFRNNNVLEKYVWLLKLNPVANIILSWHSSGFKEVSIITENMGIDFTFSYSVVYFIILLLIVLIMGTLVVNNSDIALDNKEEQG